MNAPEFLEEYRPAFSPEELAWIAAAYDGSALAALRGGYVAYRRKLETLPVGPERTAWIHQWVAEEQAAIQGMVALK